MKDLMKILSAAVLCASMLIPIQAQALNVLFFQDSTLGPVPSAPEQALINRGDTVTTETIFANFETQVAVGGWDLIVFNHQGGGGFPVALPNFQAYINAGGSAIASEWQRDAAFGAMFGVTYTGLFNETGVTVTDTGLAAGIATNPFTLINPGWGTYSYGMTADTVTDPTAVSAATFAPSGNDAIVIANGGKTIMMGFLNDTSPVAADGVALYASAITTTNLPAPVAVTVLDGGGGGCTVNTQAAFDPMLPVLALLALAFLYRRRSNS